MLFDYNLTTDLVANTLTYYIMRHLKWIHHKLIKHHIFQHGWIRSTFVCDNFFLPFYYDTLVYTISLLPMETFVWKLQTNECYGLVPKISQQHPITKSLATSRCSIYNHRKMEHPHPSTEFNICGCYLVPLLNWALIFDWCMVWWGSKSKYHKDTCLKEIGLRLSILFTMLHSIVNTIGRTCVFC